MIGSLGATEIVVVLVVLLLLFGPRQLPKLGSAIGETLRQIRGVGRAIEDEPGDDDR